MRPISAIHAILQSLNPSIAKSLNAKRWAIIGPLSVAVALTCSITAQRRLDDLRDRKTFHDELLYLPNEKILNHFTAGMDSVIADVLWIKCIQYTAEHFKGDRKFTWLNHMCNLITRLDPYFVAPYRYGGIFLAALKADDDAGIELLKKGMVRNPDAWELPYEIALTYLLNRGTRPDSPIHAAQYLAMAVETGHAPRSVLDAATALQSAHDLADVERAMWEKTRESEDQLLRDLAERKLMELDLREACSQLDRAIALYISRYNRPPKTLDDLVTDQVIKAVPADPLGGTFFIDSMGKAQNTTVLDERTARLRNNLGTAIDGFKQLKGRWPNALQELVESGIMTELPPHPYSNQIWHYDPASGELN